MNKPPKSIFLILFFVNKDIDNIQEERAQMLDQQRFYYLWPQKSSKNKQLSFIYNFYLFDQQIIQSMWTTSIGGQGGNQHIGIPNNFQNLSLVGASGRCGLYIDQISFRFVDIYTGQFVQTPRFGGNGGQPFNIPVPQGQWVTNVWLRTDGFCVTGIDFDLNGGGKAGWKGSQKGAWHCIPTNGKRIANVRLSTGALVDSLQFYLV